jgi:hypothetical protein
MLSGHESSRHSFAPLNDGVGEGWLREEFSRVSDADRYQDKAKDLQGHRRVEEDNGTPLLLSTRSPEQGRRNVTKVLKGFDVCVSWC